VTANGSKLSTTKLALPETNLLTYAHIGRDSRCRAALGVQQVEGLPIAHPLVPGEQVVEEPGDAGVDRVRDRSKAPASKRPGRARKIGCLSGKLRFSSHHSSHVLGFPQKPR